MTCTDKCTVEWDEENQVYYVLDDCDDADCLCPVRARAEPNERDCTTEGEAIGTILSLKSDQKLQYAINVREPSVKLEHKRDRWRVKIEEGNFEPTDPGEGTSFVKFPDGIVFSFDYEKSCEIRSANRKFNFDR